MTNLIETATAAAKKALNHLIAMAGGFEPGEAHLTGSAGAVCVRATSLDEDLDALLHEIQRRRGRA